MGTTVCLLWFTWFILGSHDEHLKKGGKNNLNRENVFMQWLLHRFVYASLQKIVWFNLASSNCYWSVTSKVFMETIDTLSTAVRFLLNLKSYRCIYTLKARNMITPGLPLMQNDTEYVHILPYISNINNSNINGSLLSFLFFFFYYHYFCQCSVRVASYHWRLTLRISSTFVCVSCIMQAAAMERDKVKLHLVIHFLILYKYVVLICSILIRYAI